MKCVVKMDELEIKGKELSDYAQNVLDKKIDQLSGLIKNLNWTGASKNMFCAKYSVKINSLREIVKFIDFFGYFMQYSANKYTDANVNVSDEWKKFLAKDELEDEREGNLV